MEPEGDKVTILPAQERWEDLIDQFAALMKKRVRENLHKGGREQWLSESWDQKLLELRQNVGELILAIQFGNDVIDKAVDVAVDAFIIADQWHSNGGIASGVPGGHLDLDLT